MRPISSPGSSLAPIRPAPASAATGAMDGAAGAGLSPLARWVEGALRNSLRLERTQGEPQGRLFDDLSALGLDLLLRSGRTPGAEPLVTDELVTHYLLDTGNDTPRLLRERQQAGDAAVQDLAREVADELLVDLALRRMDPATRRELARFHGGKDGLPAADVLERSMSGRAAALDYMDALLPPAPAAASPEPAAAKPKPDPDWDPFRPIEPRFQNGVTPTGQALERLRQFKEDDPIGYRRWLNEKGLLGESGKDRLLSPPPPAPARKAATESLPPPAAPAPATANDAAGWLPTFACKQGSAPGRTAEEACRDRGGADNPTDR